MYLSTDPIVLSYSAYLLVFQLLEIESEKQPKDLTPQVAQDVTIKIRFRAFSEDTLGSLTSHAVSQMTNEALGLAMAKAA